MPYQNDMSTLADVVGPAYAAQQAGIQNDQANEAEQIKNQVAAGQAPAEIDKPGLQNLFTQAQTQGQQAMNTAADLKNYETAQTMPSGIASTVAGNQAKMTADQAQKLGTLGQMAGQIAGFMDNVPEVARPAAMNQIAQQYGLDLNTLPGIADGNPDNLRNVSQKLIQAGVGYQTEMAKLGKQGETAENVANIQGNARVTSAETTAQARVQVANLQREMRQQQQTFEQAASDALKRGDVATYKTAAQMALQLRQAQAGITSQLVTGQPLTVPDASSSGAQGSASGAPDQNAIAAEMKRRGLLK